MSLPMTVEITCPDCSHAQTFQAWRSVNVTLDPEFRARLMDRTLNQFVCEQCGARTMIETGLVYNDMERKFMVCICEPEQDEAVIREMTACAGLMQADYRTRLVSDRNEMIEKVLLFEDGWDDRIMEAAKLLVGDQLGRLGSARFYYDGQQLSPTGARLVYLVMAPDTGEPQRVELDWSGGLQQLEAALEAWLGRRPAPPVSVERVDQLYGANLLQTYPHSG